MTFKEIIYWEWIIGIMIIPLIFAYIYVNHGDFIIKDKKEHKDLLEK